MALTLTPRQLTQRSHFYQQFGQLMGAGVPIVKALELLQKNPPAQSFREPVSILLAQISQGATITDAIRGMDQWMPAFDVALIQAGEYSGRLDMVLKLLAQYYEDRAAALRRMLTDLAYPALVLHMAIFLFPFIAWFGGSMSLAGFILRSFGVLALIYGAIFLMIFSAQSRRGLAWRSTLEGILRPIPVLGSARQSLALARLAAALDALTNAGVNIVEAWTMAAAASGSPAIQRAVAGWKPELAGGKTPAELVKGCSLFPDFFSSFYNSGEVSGQLDQNLRHLQTYYQEDGSRKTHFLAKWVPMAIYFMAAGYVGYKVVSYYLGYFNQINELSK